MANRYPCSEIPGQLKVKNCHFLAVLFIPKEHFSFDCFFGYFKITLAINRKEKEKLCTSVK
jgi:hypothetical protein